MISQAAVNIQIVIDAKEQERLWDIMASLAWRREPSDFVEVAQERFILIEKTLNEDST